MKFLSTLLISLVIIININAQDISFAPPQINPFGLADAGGSVRPVFVDIDNDGDLDCFDGLENGQTAYFRNNGSPFIPSFGQWTNANLFGIIDVGLNSAPAFTDINNDNKDDAFVGEIAGDIYYFRNIGSLSSPSFAAQIVNPSGISRLGTYYSPAFVDIDDDGDMDLFVGVLTGDILYFLNTGDVNNFQFASGVTNPFNFSNAGSRAAISFTDIDNDGDYDAFVGNSSGNILGYENIGDKNFPLFNSPVPNPFGLTNVIQSATPTFADIDNDGRDDCFVGNTAGNIYYFRNTSVVSVESEQNSDIVELKAYPNPVSSVLNINAANNITTEHISVFNILGQRINVNANTSTNLISLDFSSLTNGIYLLVVTNDKLNFVTKVIKTGKAVR
ncbi:MAG: T9SS type A sorting domain-containing protein [Ignavibacterium sp.]|nr:MAG: T9SS type A sorting domain-containing protein [Ignavibacterium sp.]